MDLLVALAGLMPTMTQSRSTETPWTCWWLDPKLLGTMADSRSEKMLVLVTENWRIWDCWWLWPNLVATMGQPQDKPPA